MGRVRHKRTHHARRDVSRAARTRARHLDFDQVHANLHDDSKRRDLEDPPELDMDKPGLGAYYCIECDRHFPRSEDRAVHWKSKLHKRKAKKVREEQPYTQEEADRGAGVGVDRGQRGSTNRAPDGHMTTDGEENSQQQVSQALDLTEQHQQQAMSAVG